MTTITSTEFNQNVSRAKRKAAAGPVFITDRGRASHVRLTIDADLRITDREATIAELLTMPQSADINFEPPRLNAKLFGTKE